MMSLPPLRVVVQTLALSVAIGGAGALVANAQTPTPTPAPNSAQQDATRPPGTQQNQPIPDQARPVNPNPTAPPGTQAPPPQTAPGTDVTPQQSSPTIPGQVTTPTTVPSSIDQQTGVQTTQQGSIILDSQPRPVPPLPDLTRLGVTSDNTLALSLNEAIKRALESNNDIEVARDDVRINETTLRSLQGVFDPVLNLNPQINNTVQSQQSTLGGASSSGTVSQTDITGNSNVNRQFSTGGGNYEFFFNNNRRTTNSLFNNLNPVYSASLGVTFTQPLLRNRSIDNNRRQIRIQRKRLEQSDADFRRRTIEVISQVQRAYWDLVFAYRNQQTSIASLNLTRENMRRVEAQIAAGAAAPLERAEVQTELANREQDVLSATQNISIAENTLKQLILRDPQSTVWSAQLMPTDEPSFDAAPVNLNDALTEARANRPELRRLRLDRDISDIDIQYFKNQTRPRIDLAATFATTGLNGAPCDLANNPLCSPPPTNLIGGYGQTLRDLFSFNTRNIVVGLNIQIPLRNRTAQANLAGARITREQTDARTRLQEQTIEVEVRNAAQAVETARRRVLSARAARENAEVQLQGEQRLYQVGRSTTFLLFQRENTLTAARNAELRAETDYNKALSDLQRATSTTLRANNVTVETPSVP